MARKLDDRAPPARPAAHPGRQGAARAPRRPRAPGARGRARASSRCAPTGSCSRTCSGRPACCSSCRPRRERVAVPTTIHCDHLIQARVEGGGDLRESLGREPRGLRLPALGRGQVRRRLLGAGRRDHPPGRARELRLPGRADHRHRLAHAERRRPRRVRGRRRRRRRRRGDRRAAVGGALSAAHRGVPDRQALAAGRRPRT